MLIHFWTWLETWHHVDSNQLSFALQHGTIILSLTKSTVIQYVSTQSNTTSPWFFHWYPTEYLYNGSFEQFISSIPDLLDNLRAHNLWNCALWRLLSDSCAFFFIYISSVWSNSPSLGNDYWLSSWQWLGLYIVSCVAEKALQDCTVKLVLLVQKCISTFWTIQYRFHFCATHNPK